MNVGIAIRSLVMMSALATCAALGCSKKRPDPEATSEIARREAYARALLVDGGAVAYRIGSNADVQFADGFSIVQFDPADDWRSHAFRWMGPKGHVRLRTQGNEPMRLKLGGWVNEKVIDTKPEIRLYIDGQPLSPQAPSLVDQNQFFVFEVDVDCAHRRTVPRVGRRVALVRRTGAEGDRGVRARLGAVERPALTTRLKVRRDRCS